MTLVVHIITEYTKASTKANYQCKSVRNSPRKLLISICNVNTDN